MSAWLYRLTLVYSKLDAEIRREVRQRVPDTIRLLRLQKLKLVIKDRMGRQFKPSRSSTNMA